MKTILCPTDFSEAAHSAIAYAAKLAQVTNSDLTLLNVQSLFDLTPIEMVRGKDLTLETASEQLEAQSKEVSRAFKISCYAEVEATFSKLSSVISDKAKQYDLIVMGTNGADDVYQFFTGSNSYNTIVKSKIPILLIPAGYVYSEIRKVVFAFDYLGERNLPLSRLIPFIKVLKCELKVLQVMEEAYSKKAEDDLNELQFINSNLYGGEVTIQYDTVRSAEVSKSINSYILQNQPDALALYSVHRNLFERLFHKSVIKNISVVCHYPVFVFHQ